LYARRTDAATDYLRPTVLADAPPTTHHLNTRPLQAEEGRATNDAILADAFAAVEVVP
jgi:hypothetical protein